MFLQDIEEWDTWLADQYDQILDDEVDRKVKILHQIRTRLLAEGHHQEDINDIWWKSKDLLTTDLVRSTAPRKFNRGKYPYPVHSPLQFNPCSSLEYCQTSDPPTPSGCDVVTDDSPARVFEGAPQDYRKENIPFVPEIPAVINLVCRSTVLHHIRLEGVP
jgi:hypothetical protein